MGSSGVGNRGLGPGVEAGNMLLLEGGQGGDSDAEVIPGIYLTGMRWEKKGL